MARYFLVKGTYKAVTGSIKLGWRFTTGAPMDGRPRTDAGWFTRGTRLTTAATMGRTVAWSYKPRAERAAWRLGGTVGAGLTAVGAVEAPMLTEATLTGAMMGASVYAGHKATGAVMEHPHQRDWVRPLDAVLRTIIPIPATVDVKKWLLVPRDYFRREDAEIVISLPVSWEASADMRKRVLSVVADKLGIPDATATWHLKGAAPYVTIRRTPAPPEKVSFDDVMALMAEQPEYAPLIGVRAGRRAVDFNLNDDSPHGLVSMGSGAGKSALVRLLIAQFLHNGCQVIIIDAKRISQAWARNLPGVIYCRTPESAHQVLLDLAEEVDRRYDVIDQYADDDGEMPVTELHRVGPRTILVFEEMNAMMAKLQRYWTRVKEKDDPKLSPAVESFADIINMGRQGLVHCLAVGQLLTARATGGPEIRESFGTRILGRYTMNAWKMLVPEVYPIPRASKVRGRVQVVTAGVATETQVAFLTSREARQWASSGQVQVPVSWTGSGRQEAAQTVTSRTEQTPDPLGERTVTVTDQEVPVTPVQVRRYSLAEAAREKIIPMSDAALRQAKRRDGNEFPAGFQDGKRVLYTAEELQSWYNNRPRATADAE
ncbi:FtsK/SpoIIIE domain-containing protein [Actinoplanes sp. NPDC051859]|uniref:FtsK/SpoIIIE domain-containing protein n=1 Tax=Actinoplanes sp. NPDC051859 TaxID=3363909 RepID=UPI0037A323B2